MPQSSTHWCSKLFYTAYREWWIDPRKLVKTGQNDLEKQFHSALSNLSAIRPWPNGPPNSGQSSQVHNFDGVGYRITPTWLELARVGSKLIKLKFSPNLRHVFHRLATSANSSQLKPSSVVIVMWLRGYVTKLARLGGIVWPPADAELWFCNFARVGWSWEHRLARAWVWDGAQIRARARPATFGLETKMICLAPCSHFDWEYI